MQPGAVAIPELLKQDPSFAAFVRGMACVADHAWHGLWGPLPWLCSSSGDEATQSVGARRDLDDAAAAIHGDPAGKAERTMCAVHRCVSRRFCPTLPTTLTHTYVASSCAARNGSAANCAVRSPTCFSYLRSWARRWTQLPAVCIANTCADRGLLSWNPVASRAGKSAGPCGLRVQG